MIALVNNNLTKPNQTKLLHTILQLFNGTLPGAMGEIWKGFGSNGYGKPSHQCTAITFGLTKYSETMIKIWL
jgi:hypothetical protein